MTQRLIFHIDCNSAYLSWEAAYQLQQGSQLDLRTVPSIVGGSEKSRHGIVLAKSIPAKAYKIQTGEPVRDAFIKCPTLISVPPHYDLYMKCSNAMVEIFRHYTDRVQRYSIDECFLDLTDSTHLFKKEPIALASEIKERVKKELGFTVNIGVSSNKLLAKMASDFKKPDQVHTCFPSELEHKLWPLPVGSLFMVGPATRKKLAKLGIFTIGELAKANQEMICQHLKSHGLMVWNYANGYEDSCVRKSNYEFMKGIGNGTTTAFDLEDHFTAYKVLLGLTESIGMRLREAGKYAGLVSVSITTHEFITKSHQRKLLQATKSTTEIYEIAKELFDHLWNGQPIRKLRVRTSDLYEKDCLQVSLIQRPSTEKLEKIDEAVDQLRLRFGNKAVMRCCFLESGLSPVQGGIEDDYPMMSSIL